jgi:hypothetical protein
MYTRIHMHCRWSLTQLLQQADASCKDPLVVVSHHSFAPQFPACHDYAVVAVVLAAWLSCNASLQFATGVPSIVHRTVLQQVVISYCCALTLLSLSLQLLYKLTVQQSLACSCLHHNRFTI